MSENGEQHWRSRRIVEEMMALGRARSRRM
jgi:hypothetical protein